MTLLNSVFHSPFDALSQNTTLVHSAPTLLFCLGAAILTLTAIRYGVDYMPTVRKVQCARAMGVIAIVAWWWACLTMIAGTSTDAALLGPLAMSLALGFIIAWVTARRHHNNPLTPDDGLILGVLTLMPLSVQLLV